MIYNKDVIEWAKNYDGEPFHALLCDAPYHLTSIVKRFGKKDSLPAWFGTDGVYARAGRGFMGQTWDGGDIAFRPETWELFGNTLHPGAFGMAFAASRNWHRMAVAIEDAGFVLHPTIFLWAYGQGFPKATRVKGNEVFDGHRYGLQALKPAVEPIIVFQKPYDGKPVENIVRTGAGVLNIDASRIPVNGESVIINRFTDGAKPWGNGAGHEYETELTQQGRWPSNLLLTGRSSEILDAQTGVLQSGKPAGKKKAGNNVYGKYRNEDVDVTGIGDSGGASRFFRQVCDRLDESDPVYYCSKVSPKERNAGLEEKNLHPTLKPIGLCKYLATLLLPPVEYAPRRLFVPFSGSGSEMIGGYLAGWEKVVGVEITKEYIPVAEKRIEYWKEKNGLL